MAYCFKDRDLAICVHIYHGANGGREVTMVLMEGREALALVVL